jgi:hypothetical protein
MTEGAHHGEALEAPVTTTTCSDTALAFPLPGDRGVHGDFDARPRRWTSERWLRKHRGAVMAAVAACVGAVAWRSAEVRG